MNDFNKKLAEAKGRQRKLYLIAGLGVLAALCIVVVTFIVSQGTRIDVFPEEAGTQAEISVSGGIGFTVGDTVYSLFAAPEITVSASGFKTAIKQIDKDALGRSFRVDLFELPGRLFAYTTLSDMKLAAGISWLIDGSKVDMGGSVEVELEPGEYKLIMSHPYFALEEKSFEILRDQDTELQFNPKYIEGTLNIDSVPTGAKVFLGDREVGVTPLEQKVLGGEFQVKVVAENYQDVVEKLLVTRNDSNLVRNYKLKLKQATVKVDLKPPGGSLLLDGIRVESPFSVDATLEHKLVYMKPGYYSEKKKILLAADEELQLSFALKTELGKVAVVSNPNAAVIIGGKDYGQTPLTLNLPAIAHRITLQKKGFRTITKVVTPKSGSTQRISVRLVSEKQAKLQEAPAQYTNKAGIQLKLFRPNDTFTMGAPRSEKGQRANEFQRRVQLNKPFYASLYEITNSQFAKFNSGKAIGGGNNPVTTVSWQEVAKYCNWLSKKENLSPFYQLAGGYITGFNSNSDGYRLLSEAEWEWLARKANRKKTTMFVWGASSVMQPNTANIADESAQGQVRFYVPRYTDGYSGIAPVGSFSQEISGLYDLGGNVSEWVHDIYSITPPKSESLAVNPLGVQSGNSHVIKGSNFRSGNITTLRPAFREGLNSGRDDLGFRIGRYLYGGSNGE